MLRKLHYAEAWWDAARVAALRPQSAGFFSEMAARIARVTDVERQRLETLELEESKAVDATHPPTAFRIRVASATPCDRPQVELTETEASTIEAELQIFAPDVEARIVDRYRDTLYA
jgi:hypothetical protein